MADPSWYYIVGPIPADAPAWMRRELERISQAGFGVAPSVRYQPLAVEPAKKFEGLTVYADGTNWNPGSGKGKYFFNGSFWVPSF